ncbi:MAG TPA: hypothetical protein VFT02_13925 [Pyrinomonadaceae bacterium]|nr:hypothetical protein [Pyrinomonadaceae bacterium]
MNVPIVEDDKHRIKQYLLGQLPEADEERIELRLMSDPAFSEEFDIVVDEITTAYVSDQFKGDEKQRVEQYFLRSPERQRKAQFIRELLSEVGNDEKAQVYPAIGQPTAWQRVSSFWVGQRSAFRPAISVAILVIVAGLVFWVISRNSTTPNYVALELAMTNAQRSVGAGTKRISLPPGTTGLRIKLQLPTPAAPQYRASLRGERVSLPQLAIETQDAESLTVIVPSDQIRSGGSYVIELTEINKGSETPLRGAYVFAVD